MFIEKKNVIGNVDNKIQARHNMVIHIFHMHLQYYYVYIFRREPGPPGFILSGYGPV